MSKVLTPSPCCHRAAAASQDRLNVPSFKSSHFFPQDHSFLRSPLKKRLSCWKGDSTLTFPWFLHCQQWFLFWLCSYIFSSPFVCLYCSIGSAVTNNNPQTSQSGATVFLHWRYKQWQLNKMINSKVWKTKPDWNFELVKCIDWKCCMINSYVQLIFICNPPTHSLSVLTTVVGLTKTTTSHFHLSHTGKVLPVDTKLIRQKDHFPNPLEEKAHEQCFEALGKKREKVNGQTG